MCVDVGCMGGVLQSRSAFSLNPMPQPWSINKEMTRRLIPSKLQQESQGPASLSSHLQAEFPSPPGRWHVPAPCRFPAVGGGSSEGIGEQESHAQRQGGPFGSLGRFGFTRKADGFCSCPNLPSGSSHPPRQSRSVASSPKPPPAARQSRTPHLCAPRTSLLQQPWLSVVSCPLPRDCACGSGHLAPPTLRPPRPPAQCSAHRGAR